MRQTILVFSFSCALLFGIGFALSWQNPILIERLASKVVRMEIERQTGKRLDALSGSSIAGFARGVIVHTDADIDRTREAIRKELPAQVAQVATAMLDPSCVCRNRLVLAPDADATQHLLSLVQLRAQMEHLIESGYASVRAQLLSEYRIFTASNAVALGMLSFVALLRRKAGPQLLLPATALVGGVVVTAGLYLFAQDWLHSILFNAYVGFAYVGWLSMVILLLGDILVNRARATTQIVNVLLQAAGAVLAAAPC